MGEAVRYRECWCDTRFGCQQPEFYPLFIRDRRWHQVLPDSPLGLQDSSGMVAGSHGPPSSIRLRAGLRGKCPLCSEFPRRSDRRSSAAFLDADREIILGSWNCTIPSTAERSDPDIPILICVVTRDYYERALGGHKQHPQRGRNDAVIRAYKPLRPKWA